MNIVIDQGNTSAKVAVFDADKMLSSFIFKPLRLDRLNKILNEFSPSKGILSSVADVKPEIINLLEKRLEQFFFFDKEVHLPIKINNYKTPETLGKDRIAAVVGAWKMKPGKSMLIVDVGTAITYDFIDSAGNYLGGNISPGMTVRFKALHNNTKRLPMIDENGDIPEIGYDTETAIRSGVIGGVVREIDSYIEEFKAKNTGLLVFLTGGHSYYFESRLKNSIFADGNLVLKGLNEILNYQNKEIISY